MLRQVLVRCDEHLKLGLRLGQKGGVFEAAPTELAGSFDRVSWERSTQPPIKAVVKQELHAALRRVPVCSKRALLDCLRKAIA